MKKFFIYLLLTVVLGCTVFVSCKKVNTKTGPQEKVVTLTEAQRTLLKRCITEQNKKSPFLFGTIGTVKHMALKGQHMRMFVELNPVFYKTEDISKDPEVFRKTLLDNLYMMDDAFDPMFETLADNEVGLRIELSSDAYEGIFEMYFSPEELDSISKAKSDCIDPAVVLDHHAAAFNLSLPSRQHPSAILESVEFTKTYIIYNFTVDEPQGNEMHRLRSGKMIYGSKILKSLHSSPDPTVQNLVMLCRQAHRRVAYKFTGEKSGIQVTIFFYLTPA